MKRKQKPLKLRVFLAGIYNKCDKCLHVRENEPFVEFVWYHSSGPATIQHTCWRCCRDAESTLLIQQRWPIAFERFQHGPSWFLFWSPGIEELVAKNEKA